MAPKVCIVLVNWNGWQDCIRCLESLFSSEHQNFHVIICDNASTDDSMAQLSHYLSTQNLSHVVRSVAEMTSTGAEPLQAKVCLVPTMSNLGFAGGCNIGLRHVLAVNTYDYVWLLNNDTVVAKNALSKMIKTAAQDPYDRPIGSQIHDLHGTKKLQVYGGQKLGAGSLINPRHCLSQNPEAIDFLVGASIFMSPGRLIKLGLMDEDFFLNAEDLAYTLEYQKMFRNEHPGVSPFLVEGVIWHNESSSQGKNRFLHSYYYSRNILYVARKSGALSFTFTAAHALLRSMKALLLLRFSTMRGILTGMTHALSGRRGAYPGNNK